MLGAVWVTRLSQAYERVAEVASSHVKHIQIHMLASILQRRNQQSIDARLIESPGWPFAVCAVDGCNLGKSNSGYPDEVLKRFIVGD